MRLPNKRIFPRYRMDTDFTLDLAGRKVNAKLTDLSVDGLGIVVHDLPEGAASIIDIRIQDIDLEITGKIAWARNDVSGTRLGIRRTGPLKGNMRDYRLADMLIGIQKMGKTGVLEIETPQSTKNIYFKEGSVIFATSDREDEEVGEILLNTGKITPEQHCQARESVGKSGTNQGALLVKLGYIRPEDLFQAVRLQAERVLLSSFLLGQGRFALKEGSLATDKIVSLSLNTADLIFRGAKTIEGLEKVRSEFPKMQSIVCFNPDAKNFLKGIHLSDQEKKMLQLLDGTRTLDKIVSMSPSDEYETLRTLYAFYSTQIMELIDNDDESNLIDEDEGAAKERKKKERETLDRVESLYREYKSLGYHGVLNVSRNASMLEIKRSYYRMAKEFHPDKYLHVDSELKNKLHVIFSYINEAYKVLTSSEGGQAIEMNPRFEREDDRNRTMARQKFDEGMRLFDKQLFEQALILFGQAAYLDASMPDYHYYYGLSLLRNKKVRDAEVSMRKAVRLDPYNSNYLAELGYIYLQLGFAVRARNKFEEALKCNPLNHRASEGLKKSLP